MKKGILAILALAIVFLLASCAEDPAAQRGTEATYTLETLRPWDAPSAASQPRSPTDTEPAGSTETAVPAASGETEPGAETPPPETAAPPETGAPPFPAEEEGYCVAIDPGHQRRPDYDPEPLGPGSSETKARVGSGTAGPWSKTQEYELNLAVSLLLREELEQRGYRVVMTRTTHDVNISNAERAQLVAEAGADILVRIHADGSDDATVHGALTVCMTKTNPYCAELYAESRRLSDEILNAMTAATGAKNRGVWETDTMTGVNWATMPVTIVEMGYMSNEREDRLMATEEYRGKLARGIADGVDAYFGRTAAVSAPEQSPEADGLQAILDRFLQGRGEAWDLRVESLSTGDWAAASAEPPDGQRFVSASIIKLFIAGAAYEEIEAGRIPHGDVIEDLRQMLRSSSNAAANRLIRRLGNGEAEAGLARVTDFAARIGCPDTRLERVMLDSNGKENYTTARDCAVLLRMLYEGRCVSAAWSAEMLAILKEQEDHARIDRLLPEGTAVADKTGTLIRLCDGDVGIVFSPKGDYIICMICNDYQSAAAVEDAMQRLSLEVYDWFQSR